MKTLIPIALIAALAPAVHAAATVHAPTTTAEAIARVKTAVGFAERAAYPTGIQLTGNSGLLGIDHEYRMIFDTRGNSITEFIGRVPMAQAVNSGNAWMRDIAGEIHPLYLGEKESLLVASAFVTNQWLDGALFKLDLDAAKTTDATTVLDFTLTDGLIKGEIEIDGATSRPTLCTFSAGERPESIKLGGELMLGKCWFPATISTTGPSGAVTPFTFATATPAPTFIRSPYERPIGPPADVAYDDTVPTEIEVKRAKTGHMLIRPKINGQDAGWFIFDTGAGGGVVTPELVDRLGLERFGQVPASGVGGVVMSSMCRPATVSLGPVTLKDALMTQIDLSGISAALGEDLSGVLGYNLISRSVVRIDLADAKLSVFNPAKFDDTGLAWNKLVVYQRHPCIEASFEGHTGLWNLDTGAAGLSVALHAPAVERLKLLEGRETTDTKTGGVGGMKPAKKGTLQWFEMAGHRTENVPATFATFKEGAFADPYTLGNIGGRQLKDFIIVLDYEHERIAFIKK